jgi:hypothetical protein
MLSCPYCGCSNADRATECRKCLSPLVAQPVIVYQPRARRVGPDRAHVLRNRALSLVVLGLMVKVYWGGYGPWPVIDYEPWAALRPWLEPVLLYGGAGGYVLGWILSRI